MISFVREQPGPTGRPWASWRRPFLLAFVALCCGVLLAGVSMWFLGAVALAGAGSAALTFNFHTPSAFIRLFAFGRTAAKYGERLIGHQASLASQVVRRGRLFDAMVAAPAVRAAGWQLGDEDHLADYIDDVEDTDYCPLRVTLPLVALSAGAAVLLVITLVMLPLVALAFLALSTVFAALTGRTLARGVDLWARVRSQRRVAGRLLGSALASLTALKAERLLSQQLEAVFDGFACSEVGRYRMRRDLALFSAFLTLAGPLAAITVLLCAWYAGERGTLLLAPAFLAFAWLAFGEASQVGTAILTGRIRAEAARDSIAPWFGSPHGAGDEPPLLARLSSLTLSEVPRVAPNGRRIGGAIDFSVEAGRPLGLTGPSGSGKTSLLKLIAGWIGSDKGRFIADDIDLDAPTRRRLCHFSPHDAAIMSDTVRENLFAPKAMEQECWKALDAVELRPRIEAAGGLDGWITQDMLSLGEAQRLNLARAWLSPSPIVLLDEPMEHLDMEQAARIFQRLLHHFNDRILVFACHRPVNNHRSGTPAEFTPII